MSGQLTSFIWKINDPYQIATTAELILMGNSPEDYDKHFILTTDAASAINRSPAITL